MFKWLINVAAQLMATILIIYFSARNLFSLHQHWCCWFQWKIIFDSVCCACLNRFFDVIQFCMASMVWTLQGYTCLENLETWNCPAINNLLGKCQEACDVWNIAQAEPRHLGQTFV